MAGDRAIQGGDYPLWGAYYFRWWFVRRFSEVIATPYLAGTPMIRAYYRLLGAKIGKRAFIGRGNIDVADLVTIGEDAVIGDQAMLATSSVERGLLRLGSATVEAGANVGSMAVVGRNSTIGAGAVLEGLSALPTGAQIPAGERWCGSPAAKVEEGLAPQADDQAGPVRRVLTGLALTLAALVLPLVSIIPIAPGLITMIEIDWNSESYTYLLLSPVLAITYVVLMCVLTVLAKRLILGRVHAGRYSIHSWFYVRFWFVQQINDLALRLLHPIYATLYVVPWYRALGVKVGRRAEISTAAAIVPDLVDIGPESFIADAVQFGAARVVPGAIEMAHTRIGRRSFIGNSAVLPTGASVGDNVLIGVLSTTPPMAARPSRTAHGSVRPHLAARASDGQSVRRGRALQSGAKLVATRLAIEAVRVTLSLALFIAFFSVLLSAVGELDDLRNGGHLILYTFPFLYVGFALACGFSVVLLKWLVMGRYKPTTQPLWSTFVWRTELVTATFENLAVSNLLEPLRARRGCRPICACWAARSASGATWTRPM
jgi:non-ribosomal peptide synthetase-like protein